MKMRTWRMVVAAALVACADVVRADEIVCDGEYGGHLQGVATDGESLFWSFTVEVVRTDTNGTVLATSGKVPRHQGDLCVKEGVVYVAVNLGAFNQLSAGKSEVWAYDAKTMKRLRTWPIDMPYGAGGMTVVGDRFFVIGGLPATVEENPVYEYDADFRFVRRHSLPTGFTLMGIQTAAFEDGRFLFGIYGGKGNPGGLLVCPRGLSSFVRRTGPGNVGIVKLDGSIWTARTFRGSSQKANRGKLVRSPGYPESETVYEPKKTGKGELRLFFEGVSTNGWTDCGYRLRPNGYKPLTAFSEAFVPCAESAKRPVLPTVGIGGDRSYSVSDLVRGVRRAAACDEILSVHLPGVPTDLAQDARLSAAVKAMEAEAVKLGVRIVGPSK